MTRPLTAAEQAEVTRFGIHEPEIIAAYETQFKDES